MCDAGCDAGPLSSIVWANFLASGWFVQLAHSCYFFSYLPTVSFFSCHFIHTATKMNCYLFSCFFFPTCPLLFSFLLLFSYLSTVTFFPVTFFACYFFSYLKLLLSFLLPFSLLLSFRAPFIISCYSLYKTTLGLLCSWFENNPHFHKDSMDFHV